MSSDEQRPLLAAGTPARKVIDASLPVVGWGLWALWVTEDFLSDIFVFLVAEAVFFYKCPLEIAERLPNWAPTAVIIGVAVAGIYVLNLDLDSDAFVIYMLGCLFMGVGVSMRMTQARGEPR